MALRVPRAAALALLPSLALAQTSTVTVDPIAVNRTECAGTGSVILRWTSTFSPGDTFRLVADSSCPSSAPAQNGAKTLGDDVAATGSPQSQSVSVASIRAAVTANCASVDDTTVKVCVYRIAGGGTGASTLVNGADFTFQTAVPPAPVGVTARPANAAIEVSFSPGTPADPYKATTSEYAVEFGTQLLGPFTRLNKTSTSPVRISGLTNGIIYYARVVAFSSAGNESPASDPPVSATPDEFFDFWSRYKTAGGREDGGCGAGGAGALAPLLLALAVFLRRRA